MTAELILLCVTLVVGTGLLVTGRVLEQRRLERSRRCFIVRFPRDLDAQAVNGFLRGLGGLMLPWWRRPFGLAAVVFEMWATERGITHRLLVPAGQAEFVNSQLRSAIPSARITPERTAVVRPRMTLAGELRLVGGLAPLRTDQPGGAAAALLGSLQPLRSGEVMCVQWVVVPSRTAPGENGRVARPLELLGWESAKPDAAQKAEVKQKRAEPLFMAVGRLGVQASGVERSRQLIRRLTGVLHVVRSPGSHLARRAVPSRVAADRLRRASTPTLIFPCLVNASELAILAGFPIESPRIPGLSLGGSRQLPPSADIPSRGRVLGRASFPGATRPIAVSAQDSLRGIHVIGPTGTGKSTLLLNLITQDMRSGDGVVVIDPKGDLVSDVLDRVPPGRVGDVIVLDPSSDRPVGLNPLATAHLHPELVTEQIVDTLHRVWAQFWGPRTDHILRHALLTLAGQPGMTLCEVPLILTDEGFRRNLTGRVDDPIVQGPFWGWFESMTPAERAQAIGPVLNKLGSLVGRRSIRSVFGQADPLLRLSAVPAEGKILLVSLASGLLGEDASALLGSLFFMQLWQVIQQRAGLPQGSRRPLFCHVDEFQKYANTATPIAEVVAMGRGYGLGLTLAHQHLGQLRKDVRDGVMANCRTRIVFQSSASDARLLSAEFAPHLGAHDLQGLGAYEALAAVSAGGRTADPTTIETLPAPPATGRADVVRRLSAERYGKPQVEIDQEIRERRDVGHGGGTVGRRRRS